MLIRDLDNNAHRVTLQTYLQIYVQQNNCRDINRWIPSGEHHLLDAVAMGREPIFYFPWQDLRAQDLAISDPQKMMSRLGRGGISCDKEQSTTYQKNMVAFHAYMKGKLDDNEIINDTSLSHWLQGKPSARELQQARTGIAEMTNYAGDIAESIMCEPFIGIVQCVSGANELSR